MLNPSSYRWPEEPEDRPAPSRTAYLVASGDLRPAANVAGWSAQQQLERDLTRALQELGVTVVRAHEPDPVAGHGFIDSQRRGMDVFLQIPTAAPVVVATATWQYSHHVLAGLRDHRGPILTAANWSGEWPGLVGLLNLNASLAKSGVAHSSVWSSDFTDDWARARLAEWVRDDAVVHDLSHVHDLDPADLTSPEADLGRALGRQLRREKAVLGVFDEGCMGMYNAVIDDELLNPLGLYKERLSQSALLAEMLSVPDEEALRVRAWLEERGFDIVTGDDDATELTDAQVLDQLKMYVAALRIADDFGCAAIGIQYQQGLKDMAPASDLAEGLLNDADRPPVLDRTGSRELFARRPLPHFNEVDEGVAVDALITNRVWSALGLDPSTTLHDIRWADEYDGRLVWVFMISGAVPASHLEGGYAGGRSLRQPSVYFPRGGGTLSGVCRPGELVWSRVFQLDGALHADVGRASAMQLPAAETERRLQATTPQWPIQHVVLHGVSRDQMMARHKANHVQVAYAPDADAADQALSAKAAMLAELGVHVHLCGDAKAM